MKPGIGRGNRPPFPTQGVGGHVNGYGKVQVWRNARSSKFWLLFVLTVVAGEWCRRCRWFGPRPVVDAGCGWRRPGCLPVAGGGCGPCRRPGCLPVAGGGCGPCRRPEGQIVAGRGCGRCHHLRAWARDGEGHAPGRRCHRTRVASEHRGRRRRAGAQVCRCGSGRPRREDSLGLRAGPAWAPNGAAPCPARSGLPVFR